jgi:RNA polymerase sigma factor for flagellar operon FliA
MKAAKNSTVHTPSSPSREELSAFMPIVHQVAASFLRRLPPNVQRDDLVAAGTFGLLDALRRSPERGPAFDWYARVRVRGAMLDELRAQDWLSRRTRGRATRERASGEGTGMFVAGFDDLPECEASGLVDHSSASPEELVAGRMERVALERAVAQLPEREANIVTWHYFEGVAFKDIAKRLCVSEPRISQLHSRAMTLMRPLMADAASTDAAA